MEEKHAETNIEPISPDQKRLSILDAAAYCVIDADIRDTFTHNLKKTLIALSENSRKALNSDFKLFKGFCETRGLPVIPVTPETLTHFLYEITRIKTDCKEAKFCLICPKVKNCEFNNEDRDTASHAAVRRYVSTISSLHRIADLPDPTKTHSAKMDMKAIAQLYPIIGGSRQRQAAPITLELLTRAYENLGDKTIDHFTRALVSLAYDGLLRADEITALNMDDIEVTESDTDESDGRLFIKKSKTDQGGEGVWLYISKTTVDYLKRWSRCHSYTTGPLFRQVRHSVVLDKPITYSAVYQAIKRAASAAGVTGNDLKRYTGHSCRVGAAQDLIANGISMPQLTAAGRWKTTRMPMRYTEHLQASRGGMSEYCHKIGR